MNRPALITFIPFLQTKNGYACLPEANFCVFSSAVPTVSGAEAVGGLRGVRPAFGVRRQDLGKKSKASRVLGLALSNLACMCIKSSPKSPLGQNFKFLNFVNFMAKNRQRFWTLVKT